MEIEEVSASEEGLYTPREALQVRGAGPRRRKSYRAARAALKILARQLGLAEEERPDSAIETLGPDPARPCLPVSGLYCSVSHTDRFVAAVAHVRPVGVDLECVSTKMVKVRHLYLSPREQGLLSESGLSPERVAARLWTIKEAAAKALGLDLETAIREVEVVRVGETESLMRYQERTGPVSHGEGDGHVISLMIA
jgi:phosphopantetheinyl transferase